MNLKNEIVDLAKTVALNIGTTNGQLVEISGNLWVNLSTQVKMVIIRDSKNQKGNIGIYLGSRSMDFPYELTREEVYNMYINAKQDFQKYLFEKSLEIIETSDIF